MRFRVPTGYTSNSVSSTSTRNGNGNCFGDSAAMNVLFTIAICQLILSFQDRGYAIQGLVSLMPYLLGLASSSSLLSSPSPSTSTSSSTNATNGDYTAVNDNNKDKEKAHNTTYKQGLFFPSSHSYPTKTFIAGIFAAAWFTSLFVVFGTHLDERWIANPTTRAEFDM